MVFVNSKAWGNKYYLCIPINNPDLMLRYYQSIGTWDQGLSNAYAKLTSGYMAQWMAEVVRLNVKK
jgi:hypothetical protein